MRRSSMKLALVSTLISVYGFTIWSAAAAKAETVEQTKHIVAEPQVNKESGVPEQTFSGNASWYGPQFQGKRTADGEIFDMNKLSAAHRQLHLPTKVLVENPRNGKSAVVKVNDRGPYNYHLILDLSRAAAIRTGVFDRGVAYIECTVINSKAGERPVVK